MAATTSSHSPREWSASVTYAESNFHLVIDGTLRLGGVLDVDVHAYVGILDDDPGTPGNEAGVIVDAAVLLDRNLFRILDVKVDGRLQINTTDVVISSYWAQRYPDGSLTFADITIVDANGVPKPINPHKFFLDVKGDLKLLGALAIGGQLTLDVKDDAWTIEIPPGNPLSADIFGVIQIDVYRKFKSSGMFDLHLRRTSIWCGQGAASQAT